MSAGEGSAAAAGRAGDGAAPVGVLVLVGLRCAGKTSVGRAVAALADVPFVDLDDALLARAREGDLPDAASAGDVLRRLGEPRFRDLESACLAAELARPAPRVLAAGGGVAERPANRERLAAGAFVLWLRADAATLRRRLAHDATDRPPLTGADPAAELPALAARRDPLHAALADAILDTASSSVPDLAHAALAAWRAAPRTPPRDADPTA